MKVFRGCPTPESRRPCVLTIGNFDGVHRGHQALLAELRAAADRLNLPVCVMTFEPHPREFFQPASAPSRVANLRDKLEGLHACGVDRVIVEHFNTRFASLTAMQFIQDIVVDGLHARWIMVGDDFRFGARRQGDFALLQSAGQQLGFEVQALNTVLENGTRISSSAVRTALRAGDLKTAATLLGHPYFISGHVVHGLKLGRSLGYPTLNFRVTHKRPALTGIFVVQVHGIQPHPVAGVASLGVRPTVDDSGRVLLEVHLLDRNQDLYGKLLRVEFLHKLRDEEKFDSLEELTRHIAADEMAARAWFIRNKSN